MAQYRDLKVVDGSNTYFFSPSQNEEGQREIIWSNRPWQNADPKQPFRIPLFPWTGGLGTDRLAGVNANTYAKANADFSNPGLGLLPPRVTSTGGVFNNAIQPKILEFNSEIFILDGRYMRKVNPSNHDVTQDRDFGVGKAAVDMAVFNNELVVAMGESEKIYTRSAAGTWTQATDNTFAIALGVVDSKLRRIESTNKLSSCITSPRTLANWIPASPNQYTVGDTSYSANTIVDYLGTIWVGKPDGMYAADPKFEFHNQTPQLKAWPHTDNCKGAFVAHGSLWVPSASGLYRIRWGSSIAYGPELVGRPDYRFWVRGGIEFGGNIYLLCTDEIAAEETVIVKMMRSSQDPNVYIFHEWCRLGSTAKGHAITVTTKTTNPEVMTTSNNQLRYIRLGRGGGRDIDDSNYLYGTSGVMETGITRPGPDISILSVLQGVETLLHYGNGQGESMVISSKTDGQSWVEMLTTQEGSGLAPIPSTTNWESIIRYAAVNTVGQFHEFKFASKVVTNLCTEGNFEAGTTGWATSGTNTIVQSAEQAKFGSNSLKCTYQDHINLAFFNITLTAAAHSLGVWLYIPSNFDAGGVRVQFNAFTNATGTIFADADMSLVGQWQEVQVPNVGIDAGDLSGNLMIKVNGANPTAGRSLYIDGVMCEQNTYHTGFITSATTPAGTTRPEMREAWAFGYLRPKMTDLVRVVINADEGAWIRQGVRNGLTVNEMERLFRNWANTATLITVTLDVYDETKTNRFLVTDVQVREQEEKMGAGINNQVSKDLVVDMIRVPFGPDYATS